MPDKKPADGLLPLNPRILMILLAFAEGPAHGYAIKKRAEERSGGGVSLDAGSLYRSVAQLLDQDLIEEVDRPVEADGSDQRRKYYGLTKRGREVVATEARRLAGLVEYATFTGLLDMPKTAV